MPQSKKHLEITSLADEGFKLITDPLVQIQGSYCETTAFALKSALIQSIQVQRNGSNWVIQHFEPILMKKKSILPPEDFEEGK